MDEITEVLADAKALDITGWRSHPISCNRAR